MSFGLMAVNVQLLNRGVVVLVNQSGRCCCSSRYVYISYCHQKWAMPTKVGFILLLLYLLSLILLLL